MYCSLVRSSLGTRRSAYLCACESRGGVRVPVRDVRPRRPVELPGGVRARIHCSCASGTVEENVNTTGTGRVRLRTQGWYGRRPETCFASRDGAVTVRWRCATDHLLPLADTASDFRQPSTRDSWLQRRCSETLPTV